MKFVSFKAYQPYEKIFTDMKDFTHTREKTTSDQIWFMEHQPVFTQGQAGKAEHILNPKGIPVVQSDRGGQVTYHGPGQLMIYVLLDLKRLGFGPRALVSGLENSVIDVLAAYELEAHARKDAPGVYLNDGSKIASIGLRIRKGCSYHGICFNHHLDLAPFKLINPCGFKDLPVTCLEHHYPQLSRTSLEQQFQKSLKHHICMKQEASHEPAH